MGECEGFESGMAFSGEVSGGAMPWISDILESVKLQSAKKQLKKQENRFY